MLDIVDIDMKEAIKHFYAIMNIPFAISDENKQFLNEYSFELCSFCQELRKVRALDDKCRECDRRGFEECEQIHKPYIYECHMGFVEASVPIIERDQTIGYIVIGRFLKRGNEKKVREAMYSAAQTYGLDVAKLEEEFQKIEIVSPEFIEACASVMSMCIGYLHTNNILTRKSEDISDQLEKYVENHFSEPLSVPNLCRRMYISKSKLYQLSSERFGMGISDYIRQRRIKEAKMLLVDTDRAISDIAESVGFSDANYFTRCFKQIEGMTPKEYRARRS